MRPARMGGLPLEGGQSQSLLVGVSCRRCRHDGAAPVLYLPGIIRLTPHLLSPVSDAARQADGHFQRIPMTLPLVAPRRTSNRIDGLNVDHGTGPATPLLVPPLVADDG